MSSQLKADDYRRVLDVVEACERATSLKELLELSLAAIDEHLGYSGSAFMVALASPPHPGRRAYGGVNHGFPEYVMEEYFERWADADPLASDRSRSWYEQRSLSSTDAIYAQLEGSRKRFIDDFLRRTRAQHQTSVWLDTATWTEGYLTLMGPDAHDTHDRAVLRTLRPHLVNLLHQHLPRGLGTGAEAVLSPRESEVSELLSVGFTNREIADVLHVEEDTVKKHVSSALSKLGLRCRVQLAVAWVAGAVPIDPGQFLT